MDSLSCKTILLTGATGFIGGHLADRLAKIPAARLVLLSRNAMANRQPNATWVNCAMNRLTRQVWIDHGIENIDVVFHLGAFIPKNSSEVDAIDVIYRDNLLGTRALLESLPNTPKKIIFSSTIDVYAPLPEGMTLSEEGVLEPSSLYGASKLFCEQLIKAYSKKNNCGYAILRYGHIYGPGEAAYAKLIPQVIKTLLSNESPVVYGDGSALRDYLYVGDAVEATVRAASIEGNIGPINIVRGESVTLKEIVQLLIRLAGCNIQIEFLPNKPNGNSLRFDNSQMTRLLGIWPMTNLESGLAAEIDAFRRIQNEH